MSTPSYLQFLRDIAVYFFVILWAAGWLWEWFNPETPAEHARDHHVARSYARQS